MTETTTNTTAGSRAAGPSTTGSPATGPGASRPTGGRSDEPGRTGLWAGLSGLLAAAMALAAGELAASFGAPAPGPVIAVANRVIDEAPTWFVEFGKSVFGLADKPALIAGTILISLVLGVGFGLVSRRRPMIGYLGIALFGLIGLIAIGVDSQGSWLQAALVSAVAVAAGVGSLAVLIGRLTGGERTAAGTGVAARTPATADLPPQPPIGDPTDPAVTRRRFLGTAGLVGASAAVATAGANSLRSRSSVADARSGIELATSPATELDRLVAEAATGPIGSTPDISPLVVPADDFYEIDTALLKPQVDPETWELTITGMVDQTVSYTYQDLLDRAEVITPVTLSCVSNEVGGGLVGNAVWTGVPLTELLDEAGVQPGATQIASRSVDGWSCGFPTDAAYDGRTALLAVGMNGEPLPVRHGFPARLVVAGLYGYVSATKWIKEIELTTVEDFNGYWIPRGWSKLGPVKTQSRIDTPNRRTRLTAGQPAAIAGVAWAPDTGIAAVEVQVDDEPWAEADLGTSLGADAWIQWKLAWTPTPGVHRLRVRATDESGYTQTSELRPPAPDGATGWHTIMVEVA